MGKSHRRTKVGISFWLVIEVEKDGSLCVLHMIARDFAAEAPDRKWATDVTQISIGSVELYLSPIRDMFNGEIMSYNIARCPNMEQVYHMFNKAFARFDSLDGLMLHADQGWQCQHFGYRQRPAAHHIMQSVP